MGADGLRHGLRSGVYAQRPGWNRFLQTVLLGLGLGLLACGLVFLLAFNWDALSSYQQLGLAGLGVAVPALLAAGPWFSRLTRMSLLTAAAFMVGALFAVYGQIYQTGANDFEFFLAWFLFITVWAVAADFAPLWLLWLLVGNTALYFFGEQVLGGYRTYQALAIGAGATAFALLGFAVWNRWRSEFYSDWFLNLVALGVAGLAVSSFTYALWSNTPATLTVRLAMLALIVGLLVAAYALRRTGWLSIFALALITMLTVLFGRDLDSIVAFFIIGLLALGSTMGAAFLIRKWTLEWKEDKIDNTGAAAGAIPEDTSKDRPEPDQPQPPTTEAPDTYVEDRLAFRGVELERVGLGIQLLNLLGGLVAMVCFLFFLFLLNVLDGEAARAVIGIGLLAGAWSIDQKEHGGFLDALLVSAASLGAGLLFSVFFDTGLGFVGVMVFGFAIGAVLFYVMRNYLVQLLAAGGMYFTLCAIAVDLELGQLPLLLSFLIAIFLTVWVWREAAIVATGEFWNARYGPVLYATVFALLGMAILVGMVGLEEGSLGGLPVLSFHLLTIPLVAWVAVTLLRERVGLAWPVWAYGVGMMLLLSPLFFAPAAAPALLVLLLCYHAQWRVGIVLGALAVFIFIVQYYYFLDITLLDKSFVLAATGIFFLLAYAAVHSQLSTDEN